MRNVLTQVIAHCLRQSRGIFFVSSAETRYGPRTTMHFTSVKHLGSPGRVSRVVFPRGQRKTTASADRQLRDARFARFSWMPDVSQQDVSQDSGEHSNAQENRHVHPRGKHVLRQLQNGFPWDLTIGGVCTFRKDTRVESRTPAKSKFIGAWFSLRHSVEPVLFGTNLFNFWCRCACC